MGFIEKRKKKGKKFVFAPKSTQGDQVAAYIQELEAHFGHLALEELQGQTKMRKEALKRARRRVKKGLGYIK